MKEARAIVVGLVFFVAAGAARGDLTSSAPAVDGQFALSSDGPLQPTESAARPSPALDDLGLDLWPSADSLAGFDTAHDVESTLTVRDLPTVPGSAQLLLSAMLSVGAWHLVRSAKHFHLANIPEWYHPGGPTQVGHVVPFDLDFSAVPVCCFEQPAGEPAAFYRVRWDDLLPRGDAQFFLTITSPRGPPSSP